MKNVLLIGTILIGLFLAACGADSGPEIISPVPTEVTPSETPIPTATQVRVQSAAELPTSTPFPTQTRTGFETPTLGPSPTNPLGATFTPAPPTATSTARPTDVGLQIVRFSSISQAIAPGENVTLSWQVRGASEVNIYRIGLDGGRERRWPVENSGQITVSTNPSQLEEARFILIAEAGNNIAQDDLTIPVSCGGQWFFEPSPDGCPAQPAEPTLQVEQRFEGGSMIWVGNYQQIFVFFNDASQPQWLQLNDNFKDGDQERDDSLVAPDGYSQPVRGFGLVWRTNPNIRERLGWAIQPEGAYDGVIQVSGSVASPTNIYMRNRDGGILHLVSGGRSWEIISFETIESQ